MSDPTTLGRIAPLHPRAFQTVKAAARLSALTFGAAKGEPAAQVDGLVRQLMVWVGLMALKLARAKNVTSEEDAQEDAAILYGLWRVVRDLKAIFTGDCERAYHDVRKLQTFSLSGNGYTCAVDAALWYGTEILTDAWKIAGLTGAPVCKSFPFPIFVARHNELCVRFSRDERFSNDRHIQDGSQLSSAVQLEFAGMPRPGDAAASLDFLQHAFPAGEAADRTAGTALPTVSRSGKAILGALLKYYPTLQSIEEICGTLRGEWSERTIGPELKLFIEARLAERPKGPWPGSVLRPR